VNSTLPEKTLESRDAADIMKELKIPEAGNYLAVAPGAAYGPAKKWPTERFASIARHWTEMGRRVVVVGMAEDLEAGRGIRMAAGELVLNLCGRTSMRQLLGVLARAACVVANDSGAMHLAAALGTPGVAVFGSTNAAATGPLGAPWIVLSDPPSCAPCFRRACPLETDRYACLRSVTVPQVAEALDALPI
jgi:heptosyltransferase-2